MRLKITGITLKMIKMKNLAKNTKSDKNVAKVEEINLEKSKQKDYEKKLKQALDLQAKRDAVKEEKKAQKAAKSNKPGVIQTIYNVLLEAEKPIGKPEILDKLVEAFPERKADGMFKTINAQLGNKIPNRMENEKQVIFDRAFDADGNPLYKLEL